MKPNRVERKPHEGLWMLILVLVVGALLVGGFFGYNALRDLWLEQCVLQDFARQVHVVPGKMVKADVITEAFGLRPGVNLAEIDFATKRKELLDKVPNLRTVTVTRQLPDRVSIAVEERSPIARINHRTAKRESGRVVDTEGVVFTCQRGTQALPVIREARTPGLAPGARLTGQTLAALRLIEACREPEFQELRLLEVDVSRPDFLLMTLGSYSRVKIAWQEMESDTPESRAYLLLQLQNLADVIRSRISPSTVLWNVTMPGRVFADTQERL